MEPDIFQCRGGDGGSFVELGHFFKDLVTNTRKRGPAGKHFGDFSPRQS